MLPLDGDMQRVALAAMLKKVQLCTSYILLFSRGRNVLKCSVKLCYTKTKSDTLVLRSLSLCHEDPRDHFSCLQPVTAFLCRLV